MAKRDQDVHFLASKEEVERIHQKMDELGIRSMGAYLFQQPEPVRKTSQ